MNDDMQDAFRELMADAARVTHAAMRDAEMLDWDAIAPPRNPAIAQAEKMLRAGLDPAEVRKAYKLDWNQMDKAKRRARGLKRAGPKVGEGGRKRSPESIETERLIRSGMSTRDAANATGMSRSQVQRLAYSIRNEGASA